MSFFPFINPPPNLESLNEFPTYKEIAWDFKNNQPIIENGEFKIVEGNEAIKVWIYLSLLTPNKQYPIYSWDYGSEVKELIGKNYTKALTEAEAQRLIEECLLINPYITDIQVTDTSFKDSTLTCNVKVTTIYGDLEVSL
uniref:DUF2634 domain-containing protein n=1 Tax=Siphoviridae sp. ctcx61 TaxID=2825575 RepID=A0A8S5TWH4_9CAUD|nr:MAG TPA: Protein of unknown function (DUF2634) [Siphoviridae sp. ctcx61]